MPATPSDTNTVPDTSEEEHPNAVVDLGTGPIAPPGAVSDAMKALAASGQMFNLYRPSATTPTAFTAGAFGPAFAWPLIPLHMVLLPDGRVLSYGSDDQGQQGGLFHYAVWNPEWDPTAPNADVSPHQLLSNTTGTDLFCSTQVVLPSNGQVLLAGGDRSINGVRNYAVADLNFFNPADNSLRREATPMTFRRWYGTAVTTDKGEVVVLGGRDDRDYNGAAGPATVATFAITPEIYTPGSGWRTLGTAASDAAFGATMGNWWYPKSFLAPDGKIFTITHNGFFYALDPAGSGTLTRLNGKLPATNWNTASLMYAPGKILSVRNTTSVSLVDINGPQPVVTQGPPMASAHKWGFATVLPDGSVWVNGGSTSDNTLVHAVYGSELWNPATNQWTATAAAAKPRLYHGNSMLLPNGTVLTGGGGAPGPVRNLNAEVYFPPYLFNPDGSFARQPAITGVSSNQLSWNAGFTLQVDETTPVDRVVMIRSGSSTHSFSSEQRRMELPFTQDGQTLTVQAPAKATEMPPGYYLLFVLRKNPLASDRLVPSKARIVKLG